MQRTRYYFQTIAQGSSTTAIVIVLLGCLPLLCGCDAHATTEQEHQGHPGHHQKVVVTAPVVQDFTYEERFVAQIHARRTIEVKALTTGYLEAIHVQEGQHVKQGDLMFEILPVIYQARLNKANAEVQLAEIELENTRRLFEDKVVSGQEVRIYEAKLAKAKAEAQLAEAELRFTEIRAPFDGLVDRLEEQLGSLVEEKDCLTRLSDNSVMWVYFNVPEKRYLEYMEARGQPDSDFEVGLILADGRRFSHTGEIAAIEAQFNNETGTVPFRADFINPEGLLRHGQTGTVTLTRVLPQAVVIPQRAVFDILDKHFVFVVDEQGVVHQREILIEHEQEDIFVVKEGLLPDQRFVLEGVLQVRDGEHVEYDYQDPQEVLAHLKYHAE
ncbi:MAG: hypothetical protein KatS3mg111_3263 [Pirellulaceae bacterium]|nr:MAG: hypothetical protein KatS3mg111_3263 [Pirellulaceae bacterium]